MSRIRDRMYRFYWALEKRLAPGLNSSQYCYCNTVRRYLPEGSAWLDLGCGHQIFAEWMTAEERNLAARARRVVGIDLDVAGMCKHQTIHQKVVGDLEALPFPGPIFDFVSANMVVEHLNDPAGVLREVWRVLKPGGRFVFHTPNCRSPYIRLARLVPEVFKEKIICFLESRRGEDVFPTRYRMNTDSAVRDRAAASGFELEELILTSTSATSVMLGPLVIGELIMIRLLQADKWREYRSNIVGVLRKSP